MKKLTGSLKTKINPKIRFLGQKVCHVARSHIHRHTNRHTEWLMRKLFKGFRIFSLNLPSRIGSINLNGGREWQILIIPFSRTIGWYSKIYILWSAWEHHPSGEKLFFQPIYIKLFLTFDNCFSHGSFMFHLTFLSKVKGGF